MATLTLGDGRESIVKADRALKEGGQVWVTAPRSSCGQKQPNNQSTVKAPKYAMDHNYYITIPVNLSIYTCTYKTFENINENIE